MMNRREAIGSIAAGALSVQAAFADGLKFTRLDHIQTYAHDVAKSAAFYAGVFGGPVWKNNKTPRRYVKLGPAYIAIEQGTQAFGLDHFSVGIDNFEVAGMHAFLEQHGIAYKDFPSGRDINVTDPDGLHLELSADNTWAHLSTATASPEPTAVEGLRSIQSTGIDDILLNVSNPEKSARFYEMIFGPVANRENDRIWFQVGKSRVGLFQTPAGEKPGINYFCVSANAAAPELHDPDGIRVQIEAE